MSFIDPYQGYRYTNRSMVKVSMEDYHRNHYLQNCTVVQQDPYSGCVIMYGDEVSEAKTRFEDDQRRNQMQQQENIINQFAMKEVSAQASVQQGTWNYGGISISSGSTVSIKEDTTKKVALEKAKKHASNLMKCYWARYQKNKQLTI
jgi:hypothetical protein